MPGAFPKPQWLVLLVSGSSYMDQNDYSFSLFLTSMAVVRLAIAIVVVNLCLFEEPNPSSKPRSQLGLVV